MPDGALTSIPPARQPVAGHSIADRWDAALADYRAKAAAATDTYSDDGADDASDALDVLIVLVRAPDLTALGIKMELISVAQAGFGLIPAFWDALRLDVSTLRDAT